ncbi:multicopper oxidase family protein [Acidiphilium sp. PA]|uniref:multicopper oxidase family protein n=1 Tax=Acidiphilium sp. PA TaxID=2871705 RepID=UPI0022432FDB|nr:multicopper oxidase family protein [Acidiphilium sp. PA]MCW8308048.1 multicopper oxidase family protein [Acidiphilium sp. PA]
MTIEHTSALPRRSLLKIGRTGVAAAAVLPFVSPARAVAGQTVITNLRPIPAQAAILGADKAKTAVLAYNGTVSGPVVTMHQGVPFRSRVVNGIDQNTTVHWHGIRLPNAMDGVPDLTQPPIRPGAAFQYAFTPPDAGTFWYHPHDHTAHQMGRGMAGALIVREAEPPPFDRDLLWVLQDWAFQPNDQFVPGFDTPMEAAMSGRIGSVVTINGIVPEPIKVRAGERLRVRLVNACLARFMALRFPGHRVTIIALDGQPCQPFAPPAGSVIIAPAQRVDLQLDAIGEPGRDYPVVDDFYGRRATYRLATLAYTRQSPHHRSLPAAPLGLPPNPVPKPNLTNPVRHHLTITGGMMSMGMLADGKQAPVWGIKDGRRTNDGMAPIFSIPFGRTALLTLENHTSFWHPMHLHGYSYQVLSRNGVREPYPHLRDTVIVRPKDMVDIAFVANNPGNWMFHCHVIEHQANGLMTVINVA